MDIERFEYAITKLAGTRVAGQVVAGRKTIELTEAEAEHELREGTIVAKGETAPDFRKADAVADRLRVEAAAFRAREPIPDAPAAEAEPESQKSRKAAPPVPAGDAPPA